MISIPNDLVEMALHGDKRAAFASARRFGYASGFLSGLSGGAHGSVAAYHSALGIPEDAKTILERMAVKGRERVAELTVELSQTDRELVEKQRVLGILREVSEWYDSGLALSKPRSGSLFHKVIESGLAADLCCMEVGKPTHFGFERDDWKAVAENAHVFMVEHDWAGAFKNADFDGEVRSPYPMCCFEMVLSGLHVCHVQFDQDADRGAVLFVQTTHGWAALSGDAVNESVVGKLIKSQVRAICISLDAEIALSNIVRAPHRLNAARAERGRLPIFDYHAVSLAKRARAAPLPVGAADAEPHRRRLHFRRGHWRHFLSHKTWIKWMLVGDPDLGFVDKHYRL